ncbi:ABC-type uncharacterized transport system permease subunit [Nocardioides thalensis]|uniref:ABC-type uncharacterized transport system permease subunit n=1 Tax=Nocardioides thalensis TaxID=1914755 RepID=A0A853BZ03_9ACTN|nr:hypothetical protein [Nocardioides thalensis]NYJ00455.1 ABC-type uncharacterized transport system permease subunit [Nocardioides thalensis]
MTSARTSPVVRRALAAAIAVPAALALSVVLAGPAAAGTPAVWEESDPVDFVSAALLFAGVPLLVFVVVAALVLGPSLARGESLAPGGGEQDSQWLGGPRKAAGELAAPDAEGSQAGGAGGRW